MIPCQKVISYEIQSSLLEKYSTHLYIYVPRSSTRIHASHTVYYLDQKIAQAIHQSPWGNIYMTKAKISTTTYYKEPDHPLQKINWLFRVPRHPLQSTTPPSSKYHTTSSNYHATLFKIPHNPLQSTTPPSSKYHTTLFKVPHHPLQSTTPPSAKYHTTLFKVPHHPLQSTTSPSSKYHTTLCKVPCCR